MQYFYNVVAVAVIVLVVAKIVNLVLIKAINEFYMQSFTLKGVHRTDVTLS